MQGNEIDAFVPKRINFEQRQQIVAIAASSKSSAFLTKLGSVYTAGCGMDGRLGTGIVIPPYSSPDQTNPMQISQLSPDLIIQITLGEFGGACIDLEKKLWTWGRSWGGENGTENLKPGFPEQVKHDVGIVQVSRGRQHLAFIDENQKVFTCGVGREGATGLGSFTNVDKPTQVRGAIENLNMKQVCCGRDSTFAITNDGKKSADFIGKALMITIGKLFCWGNDDYGTLGLGKIERRINEPRLVSSLQDEIISQISCGEGFTAVVSSKGELFLCGKGSDGQLGNGNKEDSSFFVKVLNLPAPVKKVSCGGGHVVVLLENEMLYVWGRGRNGQLGRSDHVESIAAQRLFPVECSFFNGKKVLDIACGGDHTMVLTGRIGIKLC